MFQLTLIAVGRVKEKFYREACAEYEKRLRATCDFTLIELPEERLPEKPGEAEIRRALAREAAHVLEKVPRGVWLCVLTPEGRALSSEELAGLLAREKTNGRGGACFVIGSSFGLDESLKRRADFRLSFSKMTFPHHLFRVMAMEQLYRAEAIQSGSRYHK